jgi:cytochrome c oxidase subunit 2
MRFKMDNVPGKTNVLRLTPNRLGEYKVRCAELCGTNHAYMQAAVRIVKDDAYAKWITDQAAIFKAPPAERGAAWAKQYGCTACHSIDGSKKVGPTWKGLAGSSVELADGTTDMADDEYLRNSILKPQSQIVEGYGENVMPRNFRERITDKQIDDLISYIKTLK